VPDRPKAPPGEPVDYRARYDAALSKAFAAQSAEVRNAYLDLASFYRMKMEEPSEFSASGPDHRFR
jgi:hypothetical protein